MGIEIVLPLSADAVRPGMKLLPRRSVAVSKAKQECVGTVSTQTRRESKGRARGPFISLLGIVAAASYQADDVTALSGQYPPADAIAFTVPLNAPVGATLLAAVSGP